MRGSYLVRRGDTFHLRMRVPASLADVVGCSELKLSLYESRKRDARLKASFLAFHIRGFFAYLRTAMQTLSRTEVLHLVKSWRTKMINRDSELRRLVETGLSSYSLIGYADACEATGDHLADLADKILPTTHLDRDRQPLRGSRLDAAREQALDLATTPVEPGNPECDWVPVIERAQLGSICEVSKRDLMQTWLPEAARLYYAKSSACAEIGSTLAAPADHQSAPAPLPTQEPPVLTEAAQTAHGASSGLSLREAWERYLAHQGEREAAWRGKTPDSARLAWDDFSALLGEQTPLAAIDRSACKRYETFANQRPKRALAAYRDLTPLQLEHFDVPTVDRLSHSGVNEALGRITSFFKWCLQEHLIARNPAEGLRAFLPEDEDENAGVQAWTLDELQTLLSPKNLKDFIDSHKHSRGASSSQRWSYFPWILVLATYTGARLDEIGGLKVSDVIEKHPESEGRTPVLLVRPNEHRGLKTDQAKRSIPIHPDLERLGLWDLLRHRRDEIKADLFLWPSRRGDRVAGKTTDDFREYTSHLGLYQPRTKVFHSFRHTFKTRARGVVENGALNSIVGHQANDSTGGVYEHALEIPRHKHLEQLRQLTFGLDIEGLSALLQTCRSVAPITAPFLRAKA